MKKVLLMILAFMCVFGLAACEGLFDSETVQKSYVITFQPNNGEEAFTITTTGNESILLPDAPVRNGYTFDGWYFDENVWNKPFTEDTLLESPIFHDRTVYARWIEKEDESAADLTYHVRFETNGGTPVAEMDTNRIKTAPVTTREGYDFEGWYLYQTLSFLVRFPYIPDSDVTLYAKWKKKTVEYNETEYTVSFAKGDPLIAHLVEGEIPPAQNIKKNNEITLPANPFTREGYIFTGWSDGTATFAPGYHYTVTAEVTFTAVWMLDIPPVTYVLSFGPGEGTGISGTAPASANYEVNETIVLPQNPFSRSGYSFGGWYDASIGQIVGQPGSLYNTRNQNVTLVAKWNIINYTITYNNMGDAVNPSANPLTYTITTPTFTLIEPAKSGYSFEGWYLDAGFTVPANTTIATGSTGARVFYAKWTKIELTKRLTSAGKYAITGYTSNSSEIIVPQKIDNIDVVEIDAGAFRNNTMLTNLVIPDSVTKIGAGIVNGCYNLTTLTIPFVGASADAVGQNSVLGYLFGAVAAGQPGAVIQNFVDNPTVGFAIPGSLKSVTLTAAVSVPRAAFQNIASLERVTLNKNVVSVGAQAFASCRNLVSVQFGEQSLVASLGNGAFYKTTSLTGITLPSGLTTIGQNCFAESGLLTLTIPVSVTEIGAGVLDKTNITALSVPFVGKNRFYTSDEEGVLGYFFSSASTGTEQRLSASVSATYSIPASLASVTVTNASRLMYGAFSNCVHITNVTLSAPLSQISDYALYNTGISGALLPATLTSIGAYAYANNSRLLSVTIPAGVTTLGTGAFRNCTALRTVSFPVNSQVSALPQYCFQGDDKLDSLVLHDVVRTFGAYAFQGCSSLARVNISTYATSIGAYAFADCTRLYSGRADGSAAIIIGASITSIGEYAFYRCSSIRLLTFTTGGNLTSIGDYAFAECTGIGTSDNGLVKTTINIPNKVTTIGDYAFYNCRNVARLSLTPATAVLTTIGRYAFANWETLGRNLEGESFFDVLTIPASVVTIGAHAFENAKNLRQLSLSGNKLTTIGDYAFAGTAVFGRNRSNESDISFTLSIPNSVTSIGAYAFAGTAETPNLVNAISFTQDSLLRTLGEGAFAYCAALSTIFFSKTVSSIGSGALTGTASLQEIRVDIANTSYVSVGFSLFTLEGTSNAVLVRYASGRTGTSYRVPTGTREIGPFAFEGASRLHTITLNSSVKKINEGAFYGISAEILFDNPTISEINPYAFKGYQRTSVELPDTLTRLHDYALAGAGFTQIDIPQTVTRIGAYVVAGTPVQSIALSEYVTQIADAAFAGCPTLEAIDVSSGNGIFVSDDGILYERQGASRKLLQYPAAKPGTEYTVNENVVAINAYAFYGCALTSLTVPSGVTSIAPGAFAGMNALTELTVPFVGVSSANATSLGAMFETSEEGNPGAVCQGTAYYQIPAGLIALTVTDTDIIANYAFQNTGLLSVTFASRISDIGMYAFSGCAADVVFDSLLSIGDYAFAGYLGTSFVLPQSVVSIAEYAFFGSALTSVDLSSAVLESIGQYAFADTSLASLRIPSSVTVIGKSIAEGIDTLRNLEIPFIGATPGDDTNTLAYFFGAYTANFQGAVSQIKKNGSAVYAKIPVLETLILTDSVFVPYGAFMNIPAQTIVLNNAAGIAAYAFSGCTALVRFAPGASISVINSNSFRNYAYAGDDFVLPDSILEIESYAFYEAEFEQVIISAQSGLEKIGQYAFADCGNMRVGSISLPASVLSIGAYAYYHSGIRSVYVPASVTSIGDSAFGMCPLLTQIDVAAANALYKSIGGGLYTKNGETLIQYPAAAVLTDVSIPSGVITIGPYAFAGNTSLESVTVPATVTKIDQYAFAGTAAHPMSLNTVVFASGSALQKIMSYAFAYCTALSAISVPRYVNEIGEGAFSGSEAVPMNLVSVSFAENSVISQIGEGAFAYCNKVASLVIPTGIGAIGAGALRGWSSLESLTLPYVGLSRISSGADAVFGAIFGMAQGIADGTTLQYYSDEGFGYYYIPSTLKNVTLTAATRLPYGAFYGCSAIEQLTLNASIASIESYAFYSCSMLRSLTIPDNVATIGAYAFAGTSYRPMSLETVIIRDTSSLETIGAGAFYNCASLNDVYLPSKVRVINEYLFYNTPSLTSLTIDAGSMLMSIGDYAFYNSGIASLAIPAGLSRIGASAFENSQIAEFSILPGVYRLETIGDRAFAGCVRLEEIWIPGTLLSNGMGNRVFYNCTGLTRVTFAPGGALADLGDYSFYNCPAMEEIILPQNLASIGRYQFYGARALKHIMIPATVVSIGSYAFAGKDGKAMGLLTVSFAPGSVLTEIQSYAFNLCYNLTEVEIPDSLQTLGEKVFYNCSKLAVLHISQNSNLQSIGEYAVSGCISLTEIYIPANLTFIGNGAFRNTNFSQINVSEENAVFMSDNGNLLTKNGQELIKYASGSAASSYTIPATVTRIKAYAFADAANLTTLNLPDSLTVIEEFAFSSAVGITSIVIPETVSSIGTYAFYKAYGLRTVVFEGNSELASLGTYAFAYCTRLLEIVLPQTVTEIPDSLFYGCTSLFAAGIGPVTSIGKSAFYGCTSLALIILPATLQTIQDYAFYNCYSLTSVTLGPSVGTLGEAAFAGCQSLTRFEVSENNSVFVSADGVLYTKNYSELLVYPAGKPDATIMINSRTTRIRAYAFLSAKKLKSLSIPSRITFIGYRAFYGAASLVLYCQSESKPSGWDNEWNTACPVNWASSVNYYGNDYQFIVNAQGNAIITRYLGVSESFSFPETVETIDSDQPIPVVGIGAGAMLGIDFVYSVLIPANITSIAARAFANNPRLTIYCQAASAPSGWNASWNPDGRPVYWSVQSIKYLGNFEYVVVNSGNVTVTRYTGSEPAPVIPTMIEGIYVTKIGSYAFSDSDITGIALPENLAVIDTYAFAYCSALQTVELPSKVRTIGNFAFAYCTALTYADISAEDGMLTSVGWNAFTGCTGLEQIRIPYTVTSMGGHIFKDCGASLQILCEYNQETVPAVPNSWNVDWRLKGYDNGIKVYYNFYWLRV